ATSTTRCSTCRVESRGARRKMVLLACVTGCAARVELPTQVQAPATSPQTVWVAAGADVPDGDEPVIWFADVGGVDAESLICHASHRKGPLWQQMDLAGVRFICVANPDRLSRKRRLEQRFQAPMSASPTSGMPLVIAAALTVDATSAVTDDLEAFSDALALQLRIRRGPTSQLLLGESEWGPPTIVVGPNEPVELTVSNGQTHARIVGTELVTGELGQWVLLATSE
ncbi:MAG: hypothetical protein AB8H79_17515, partial [Myxococcota bacterium]